MAGAAQGRLNSRKWPVRGFARTGSGRKRGLNALICGAARPKSRIAPAARGGYIGAMSETTDIIIAGGGIAGMACALAIAARNAGRIAITLVDAAPPAQAPSDFDGRAYAIAASSYAMLEKLGVAAHMDGQMQALTDILISDGDAGAAPSPRTLHFDSTSAGDGRPMGYLTESRHLHAAMAAEIDARPEITRRAPDSVSGFDASGNHITASLQSGRTLSAKLLIAADGRGSALRKLAGIQTTGADYDQIGIVTTVSHELPHNGVAHELFLPSGPFAILPLPDGPDGAHRSSIVWSEKARAAKAALALPDAMFEAELARRFGDHWGAVKVCAPDGKMLKAGFPLSLQMAKAYTAPRFALLGDAAHAIHPIAGQGLNMGLRDAAAMADVIADALDQGRDIGGAQALSDYAAWRNFDNGALATATDLLNRLFSNTIAPVRHLRRLGIAAVDKIAPARSFFIREAAGQIGDLPTLLQD